MKHYLRNWVLYILLRGFQNLVLLLPRKVSLLIGGGLGKLAYFTLHVHRKISIANLREGFKGEKTVFEIRTICMALFSNLGKNMVETLCLPRLTKRRVEELVPLSDLRVLDEALSKERGVIILSPHLGNWELLAAFLGLKGYRLYVIARDIRNPFLNQFLLELRKKVGVETIDRASSGRVILEVLKKNGILGILPDQDVDSVSGLFVDFFGKEAYTPTGPVALAMASGAPIIPCFLLRKKDKHALHIEKPLDLDLTGRKKHDLLVNTQRWSRLVEKCIRDYPSQWVWMHQRWKTKEERSSLES